MEGERDYVRIRPWPSTSTTIRNTFAPMKGLSGLHRTVHTLFHSAQATVPQPIRLIIQSPRTTGYWPDEG